MPTNEHTPTDRPKKLKRSSMVSQAQGSPELGKRSQQQQRSFSTRTATSNVSQQQDAIPRALNESPPPELVGGPLPQRPTTKDVDQAHGNKPPLTSLPTILQELHQGITTLANAGDSLVLKNPHGRQLVSKSSKVAEAIITSDELGNSDTVMSAGSDGGAGNEGVGSILEKVGQAMVLVESAKNQAACDELLETLDIFLGVRGLPAKCQWLLKMV